mmetsp:Transcript_25028/g.36949  ORF Transcript_25028/g.36949 Transcript_25028/m.36949 type:complete len:178 (-) Transcript_25028:62-595(-)
MWQDAVFICTVSAAVTLLSEGISWYFIYRKAPYQRLKEKIEKTYYSVQRMKRDGGDEKTLAKMEKDMKRDNTQLSGMKMYSLIFLSIVMFVLYQVMRKTYSDVVVAKLPFEPLSLFTKMTHSGLTSLDMTDCSFGCIYGLSTFAIRANLQKMIGNGTPKGVGSMFDQMNQLSSVKED